MDQLIEKIDINLEEPSPRACNCNGCQGTCQGCQNGCTSCVGGFFTW